ncbi:hypothetical protein HYPSUDRAFT_893940 [Hypholoma sublateritium FD-334 SS-4]|uniref:F-box domain-containing protein n=1 Tax=Hypholoma sublateritium (strain FD-334 SS-4) TaxID=945553 RepID=A0A0D2PH56_HYPSF|nr:hypothetical protein HYPSUDRAFT_893940 [Hypholoma sublateritium FD-334 SS-4]
MSIQRLDVDILWAIFLINADMFNDHRALETTLATSRVCHGWRSFMLEMTSMWAHLIDLDHRLWRTVEGRRELMRRSGTGLLWMKTDYLYLRCAKNILGVLSKNWERIQRLEVTMQVEHVDLWLPLYLPAPHLESFDITFREDSHVFKHVVASLFGGHAPMLRELRFSGYEYNFTARPSWLHQLRSLDLSVQLKVSETLEVLALTPNLVNLRLGQMLADRTSTTPSPVSLTQLAHLDLNLTGTLTPGAVLMDNICIPTTCSLTFSARLMQLGEIDNTSTFTPTIRAISTYVRSSFTHHAPRMLSLTITPRHFILETATLADGPTFRLRMELAPHQVFPMQALTVLLRGFSLPCFSTVTSFSFAISGMDRPALALSAFMACLPSVTAIRTDKWSLRHLLSAQAAQKGADTGPLIAFPMLEILTLRSFLSSRLNASPLDSSPDPVSKFVMARIAHGHAIGVVDFTENTLDSLPSMAFLRKADGLKVRWRQGGASETREYMCGTGAPRHPGPV